LLISARSLQLVDAVPMIALTSAAANLTTIAAGPIVFGESLPGDRGELVLRMLAFALVIVAAARTPPPTPPAAALVLEAPDLVPAPPPRRSRAPEIRPRSPAAECIHTGKHLECLACSS